MKTINKLGIRNKEMFFFVASVRTLGRCNKFSTTSLKKCNSYKKLRHFTSRYLITDIFLAPSFHRLASKIIFHRLRSKYMRLQMVGISRLVLQTTFKHLKFRVIALFAYHSAWQISRKSKKTQFFYEFLISGDDFVAGKMKFWQHSIKLS